MNTCTCTGFFSRIKFQGWQINISAKLSITVAKDFYSYRAEVVLTTNFLQEGFILDTENGGSVVFRDLNSTVVAS